MRYPPEHKAKTRARLIEAARLRFRAQGFDGPTIDQICGDAGITRGAFYAHFVSKRALVLAVLGVEAGLVGEVEEAGIDVAEVLARYLEPARREEVVTQCPLAAHPVDVRRGGLRAAYEHQLLALVNALHGAGLEPTTALELAVATVGAVVVAGAVEDEGLAARIAAVGLRSVDRALA